MEIFQTIWTALTTQNETLSTILYLPIYFVDAIVNMLLFTTILNIKYTKKNQYIYVILMGLVVFTIRTFLQTPFVPYLNILLTIVAVKIILKPTWLKSLLAEFIVIASSSILELFMSEFYFKVLNIPYDAIMSIPLYRILCTLSIYLCVYLIYKIIKYFKFNIDLENMTRNNKILFFINTLLGIVAIGTQFYLIMFYSNTMPTAITVVSILSLLAYFFISFYSLTSTNKLDTTSRDLEEATLYNKTLSILHDTMRTFKHDFHNIVQAIGGYAEKSDMEGLKKYYKQLLEDCNRVNNLTALNPSIINNPAIYNILATKYHESDKLNIQINLGIFIDLNNIEKHMRILEFTRILGILMDNAIEAAKECEEKTINVNFRNEEKRHRLVMIIENTYKNKDIDVEQIFQKAFSTKSDETNSGLRIMGGKTNFKEKQQPKSIYYKKRTLLYTAI